MDIFGDGETAMGKRRWGNGDGETLTRKYRRRSSPKFVEQLNKLLNQRMLNSAAPESECVLPSDEPVFVDRNAQGVIATVP
tara:strand:- start:275 stop:517 length:243 start_codon:yes stop_codon:yes gene_type:complete